MRRTATVALLLIASATLWPASAAGVRCRDVTMPVALEPGDDAAYSVYGLLCPNAQPADLIEVFVSGATEGGVAYWDFPTRAYYRHAPLRRLRSRYSYVKYLAERGYDSITLDRIGTGRSSRPPAHEVTVPSNAYVVDQVVDALRSGALAGHAYGKIVGVGRSLGAAVLYEASVDHGGFDGLIIQSFRQHRQPAFALFPSAFMPAQLEPRLADAPAGYITTRPDTRGDFFFYRPNADERVISIEERLKETITPGEIATLPQSFDYTARVAVPVVSLVGEYDTLFCSAAGCPEADQEAGVFPNAACFESHVVPDAGHDMNLQLNSQTEAFPLMLDWIERNFAADRVACD